MALKFGDFVFDPDTQVLRRHGVALKVDPQQLALLACIVAAIGATHIPTPDAATIEISVPWFRWKLLDDKRACEYFKALPDGDRWNKVADQNPAPCM